MRADTGENTDAAANAMIAKILADNGAGQSARQQGARQQGAHK
jgi:hypothetical protein